MVPHEEPVIPSLYDCPNDTRYDKELHGQKDLA